MDYFEELFEPMTEEEKAKKKISKLALTSLGLKLNNSTFRFRTPSLHKMWIQGAFKKKLAALVGQEYARLYTASAIKGIAKVYERVLGDKKGIDRKSASVAKELYDYLRRALFTSATKVASLADARGDADIKKAFRIMGEQLR